MGLLDSDRERRRYLRVYDYYRELIRSGKLAPGTKLPSIRKCAAQLSLSRTTVESAYLMLAAEGYIISRPQSGYYVTELLEGHRRVERRESKKQEKREIRFDFASSNVDRDSFQFDLWRRYVKSALRQDERLLSYGEPQGEWEFREALCGYLSRHRNVICTPEHIVVGAGVQSLLHVLCPMVRERGTAVLYNPQFSQGRTIFEDYGFQVRGYGEFASFEPDSQAKWEGNSRWDLPPGSLFYLTPSQMTVWGEVLHISERTALIRSAQERDMLLIEDDYNSEFRYYTRPTPSLQGLSGGHGVVYLGTFSRLLLPSIRMSYMVLPPELLPLYQERAAFYNQTASKAEQIALCQFIRDGHLEGQIRKTRKLYAAKARQLCETIESVFGERAKAHLGEAGFLVLAEIRAGMTSEEIAARAAQAGVAVRAVREEAAAPGGREAGKEEEERQGWEGLPPVSPCPKILLSCSTVAGEHYEEALLRLREAVFS